MRLFPQMRLLERRQNELAAKRCGWLMTVFANNLKRTQNLNGNYAMFGDLLDYWNRTAGCLNVAQIDQFLAPESMYSHRGGHCVP